MYSEDVFHLGVKALIKDQEGKILLLKVNPKKLPGHLGPPYWDIPGGRIKKGDDIFTTLRREVFEETGISIDAKSQMVGATVSNIRIPINGGDVGLILFIYRIQLNTRPKVVLSAEHTNCDWSDPSEATQALLVKYPLDFARVVTEGSLGILQID